MWLGCDHFSGTVVRLSFGLSALLEGNLSLGTYNRIPCTLFIFHMNNSQSWMVLPQPPARLRLHSQTMPEPHLSLDSDVRLVQSLIILPVIFSFGKFCRQASSAVEPDNMLPRFLLMPL